MALQSHHRVSLIKNFDMNNQLVLMLLLIIYQWHTAYMVLHLSIYEYRFAEPQNLVRAIYLRKHLEQFINVLASGFDNW